MANADLISALHPFRGSCKPEWLFIIAGLFTKRIFVLLLNLATCSRRSCRCDAWVKCCGDEGHGEGGNIPGAAGTFGQSA